MEFQFSILIFPRHEQESKFEEAGNVFPSSGLFTVGLMLWKLFTSDLILDGSEMFPLVMEGRKSSADSILAAEQKQTKMLREKQLHLSMISTINLHLLRMFQTLSLCPLDCKKFNYFRLRPHTTSLDPF